MQSHCVKMGPRRNANDCFFYYRGYCYKGNRCSYRHEPRALGSQVICKLWQRRRCYIRNCPQRHSRLKNSDPQIWEDRLGHTPFLKSRYLLEYNRSHEDDEGRWVRTVYLDSSTFSIRNRRHTNAGYQKWGDVGERYTRGGIKVTLRRNPVSVDSSPEDNRFPIYRWRLPRYGASSDSSNTTSGKHNKANSGVMYQELFSHSTSNLEPNQTVHYTDSLELLTFVRSQKQSRNSHLRLHFGHLEFENSSDSHSDGNCSSSHQKRNVSQPLGEQENSWSDSVSDVNGNSNSGERQQIIWHVPSAIDDSDGDSSPSSIIIHKESNISCVHEGSGYNGTYGTEDDSPFHIQVPKNSTECTSFVHRNRSIPTVENVTSSDTAAALGRCLREDAFTKRSHSVSQQPIPRIRLKRSKSAGSKETWKIHSPRSKKSKYSHESGNSIMHNHRNYLTLPQNVSLQADIPPSDGLTISEQMFYDTSGSDLTEELSHRMQHRSRSRTRNTSSLSV